MPSDIQYLLGAATWQGKLAASGVTDKITVANLQVTANAGTDAWGRQKSQPALITVTLSLAKSFDTAAEADALDNSTVHYGQLSKHIRSTIEKAGDHLSTEKLAQLVHDCASETAGETPLRAIETHIFYPKGSLLGDGAGYLFAVLFDPEDRMIFSQVSYLKNVRIPCVIGINDNERLQKQPVVINVWLDPLPSGRSDDYARLEAVLANVRYMSQVSSEPS